MTIKTTVKRFRREVRERQDIGPNGCVVLAKSPERIANVLCARLLLADVFGDRIRVEEADTGIVCGSREEAAAWRLAEYTRGDAETPDLLLSGLTREEIGTYLKERTGKEHEVFVPDTPEVRFLEELATEFGDIRYGL